MSSCLFFYQGPPYNSLYVIPFLKIEYGIAKNPFDYVLIKQDITYYKFIDFYVRG